MSESAEGGRVECADGVPTTKSFNQEDGAGGVEATCEPRIVIHSILVCVTKNQTEIFGVMQKTNHMDTL